MQTRTTFKFLSQHCATASGAFAIILFTCSTLAAIDDHGREIRPASWRQDATINDVFFVDANHGWAVGDQGLILRTTNGGEDWIECDDAGLDFDDHRPFEQKLSNMRPISRAHELYPLTCSLKCVHFSNRQRGCIAGNYYTPFLGHSHSVVLVTEDGGQTWKTTKNSFLPQINRIHFQEVLGGWALGRSGNLYKSGVLTTASGGRSWSSQNVEPSGDWIDGDLVPSGFVVIDGTGWPGKIAGGNFEPAVVLGPPPGKLASVRMFNAKIGWAVGAGGTVLTTANGGASWRRPESLATDPRFHQFDFASVSIVNDQVWLAGNPGTFIVSFDAATGDNVRFHRTPLSLPIKKIKFADPNHGWAVGGNGLILSSSNAGRTWTVQRLADEQLGLLIATETTHDLPFALMANYSSEENVIAGCVIIGPHSHLNLEIADSAMQRLGCGVNVELRVEGQESRDESCESRDLAGLVRSIRTLRPTALVCNCSVEQDSQSRTTGFIALCRAAVEMAASKSSHVEQIEQAGLSPWQVDRLLIRTVAGSGELNLAGNRYLAHSGLLVEDQIAISRGLTNQSPVFNQSESYRIESFTGSISALRHDIFYGLEQLGRQVPHRRGEERWGNMSSIATAPLKHNEINRLLNLPTATPAQTAELQNQIRAFGSGQESRELGIWLMQLAEGFLQRGNLEMTAYTLEQMINRIGDHPFTPAALLWLVQFHSSSEISSSIIADFKQAQSIAATVADDKAAGDVDSDPELDELEAALEADLAETIQSGPFVQSIPTTVNEDGAQMVVWEAVTDQNADGSAIDPEIAFEQSVSLAKSARIKMAGEFLNRLKQRDPDLALSEQVLFMEANLSLKIPGDLSSENLFKRLRRTGRSTSDFGFAASRELRLRDNRFDIEAATCFQADSRPRLDGDLNDDLWQNAVESGQSLLRTMRVPGKIDDRRTDVVWLAHDQEFMYLAARCNLMPGKNYPPPEQQRVRDADLAHSERVQLKLDFDRDCQSEFTFEIDDRGRLAESCAGSAGWNPTWYVATGRTPKAWTIECAIPLSELTVDELTESTWIAFSLRRLNHDSADLWSDTPDRARHVTAKGIAAGLNIRPRDFELLRFDFTDEDAAPSSNIKKSQPTNRKPR